MSNKETLIPQAHTLTVEEASKGGKKSAEVRREKKNLKRAFDILLERDYADGKGGSKCGAELIAFKQFEKALQGDSRAFEVVRDTAGQKPIEKVEVAQIDPEIVEEVEKMIYGDDEE